MRRVAVLAVITGVISASCSGGHSASTIPAAGGQGAQSPLSLTGAHSTAATVEKAFNTTLHGFSVNGAPYFANTQPAFVPSALGGNVVAVLGLTNFPGLKANPVKQPAAGAQPGAFDANGSPSPTSCLKNVNVTTGAPVCPHWYDPATFNITYDAGSTPPATNTEVAIFVVGNPAVAISDFRYGETQFGLPQAPINEIHVQPQSTDVTGNGEWTLVMTYAQGGVDPLSWRGFDWTSGGRVHAPLVVVG